MLFWKTYLFEFIDFSHSRFAHIFDSKPIFFIEYLKIPLTYITQRTKTCCFTSVIVNKCVMWKNSSKILRNNIIICDWKKIIFVGFPRFFAPRFAIIFWPNSTCFTQHVKKTYANTNNTKNTCCIRIVTATTCVMWKDN